jgi:hypothetical protein
MKTMTMVLLSLSRIISGDLNGKADRFSPDEKDVIQSMGR